MARRGRWSGCHGDNRDLIVVDGHVRIPPGEQVAQRAVEGFGSGLQEPVGTLFGPLHRKR